MPSLEPALLVDRDGTLNVDLNYLADAERLEIFRGVGAALRLARAHGYRIVCVTNQSGIARGLYTHADVAQIHRRLNERLALEGARVDAFYYCPHRPEDRCSCRKPGTALLEQALGEHHLDPHRSAMIGDRALDVAAGRAAGLLTGFIAAGPRAAERRRELLASGEVPDVTADSFYLAVLRILGRG
jgi:D-glycero-D-manno-heptose 1,7-bisphosphate phosphatase